MISPNLRLIFYFVQVVRSIDVLNNNNEALTTRFGFGRENVIFQNIQYFVP